MGMMLAVSALSVCFYGLVCAGCIRGYKKLAVMTAHTESFIQVG